MKKLVAYLFQCFGKYSIIMISLFILLILAPSSYCQEDKYYSECVKPFDCGNLKNLSYPFWRDGRSEICGFEGFKLLCVDDAFPAITIENKDFLVVSVNQSQKEMAIARMDLLDDPCPDDTTGFTNITLTSSPFSFVPDFYTKFSNITLFYNCTGLQNSPLRFVCSVDGEEREAFYGYDGLWMPECTIKVWIPVPKTSLGLDDLGRVLRQGFNVSYKYEEDCVKCSESGGICGTNLTNPGFTCLCPGHPYPDSCPKKTGSDRNIKLKVGIASSFFLITSKLHQKVYPKVKVRTEDEGHEYNCTSLLSLKDVSFLVLHDSCFPVKVHRDMSPPPPLIARVPKSYVPNMILQTNICF
ncbi:LEAF RUST 10 DISEASE-RESISTANCEUS RECEPTOR-LIKE PROTEIN KINASE-like 2.1 isoform X2 [Euphorbia lathyris]|uniref:LEAF RUST 10 DISEASE-RESISTANCEUS RECEPTOR-LIKE PROTEIN KINASE-like 2.1 isoform X2 n=1 Tax=Euphorbia lathyris TaxID=212925 RepID=UPI0033139EC1